MRSSLKFLKEHALPAAVAFGLAFALAQMGWLDRAEDLTLDGRTKWRAHYQAPPDDRLTVVGIDEPSLKALGPWPWQRLFHAHTMDLMKTLKPSVVGWDILFTEGYPTQDPDFAKSIKESGSVVILGAMMADGGEGSAADSAQVKASSLMPLTNVVGDRARIRSSAAALLPADELGRVAKIGFVDTPPDAAGVRRMAPLLVRVGEQVYPTLSMQSLLQYWKLSPEQVQVRLGEAIILKGSGIERRIPIDETGAYLINYRRGVTTIRTIGYRALWDVVEKLSDGNKRTPELKSFERLAGSILLVGQMAEGLSDFGPTPLSELTPLVLVHANVIENILQEDYAWRAPVLPVWLGGFLLGVAGLAFFSERRLREQAAFSLGVPLVYVVVATLVWVQWSWWLLLVGPVLGFSWVQVFMIARRMLHEQRAKAQIRGMFGNYVSPEIVSRMVEADQPPRLGGHEADVTAYFSDIQGYSTFSEKLPPAQLVELLNEYLTACTDIVQGEGGTLDKYIGDAVVAFFGAPIPLPDHAARACVAALRVQHRLGELRTKWEAEGARWPGGVRQMQSRIGLNSGPAIVGNMGSRTRFNYTMTGDNVNLAARMESGAKQWGVYTMTTEATRLACEKHGGDRVVFRPLGRIRVLGRTTPVPIYELAGLKEHLTGEARECIRLFTEALACHDACDWERALDLFGQSAKLEPNQPGKTPGVKTNPSSVYLDIVRRYQAAPPPDNWDGIFEMREK